MGEIQPPPNRKKEKKGKVKTIMHAGTIGGFFLFADSWHATEWRPRFLHLLTVGINTQGLYINKGGIILGLFLLVYF